MIAIIGAGFSGLGMAIRLKQNGIDDFTIFEQASDVGGTWRDNTYPGCACDVESHLYSFSFAPNPSWSRMYSGQKEIWDYLRKCARDFGILPHIKFEHAVENLVWDEAKSAWTIETSKGVHEARIVVAGTGPFSAPVIPKLPGLDSFRGKVMHSARWDHAYDLAGKNVAVIGTGASAIQFVPKIQPLAGKLFLFQRTPPWIVPHVDRPIDARERGRLARFPLLQKFLRGKIYVSREFLGLAFRHPWLMRPLRHMAVKHIARAISDPALRAKLTPNYTIGCKRILISNDYYPALAKQNVDVITEGIREVKSDSIVTNDGVDRKIDALIFGTGFQVADMPIGKRVRGRGGARLADQWEGSPRGYLGTSVAGFPNLFLLLGPNTGLGHNSVVLMIECQIDHVLKAVKHLRAKGAATIEAKREAQEKFVAMVDSKMRRAVWISGGCTSWYLDRTGRNSTLWPMSVGAFRRRVCRFKPSDYAVS